MEILNLLEEKEFYHHMWKVMPDQQIVKESGKLLKVIAKHGKLKL